MPSCVRSLAVFVVGVWSVLTTGQAGAFASPAAARPRTEHVCPETAVLYNISSFDQLTNCSVIEGNLEIRMIDASPSDFEIIEFPKLREITGYLLLHRVSGLLTLENIFPNLGVLRGRTRFFNYALMVYEMLDFKNIGLKRLTTIEQGAVRFEKNPNLCYINNIDWTRISLDNEVDHVFRENKNERDCVNFCPDVCQQEEEKSLCWNSNDCQIVPGQCRSCGQHGFCAVGQCSGECTCCHPECLGECTGPTASDCVACKHVFHNGTCMERCPQGLYNIHDRRCVTERECQSLEVLNPATGQTSFYKAVWVGDVSRCVPLCPKGYLTSEDDPHTCLPCQGVCPKVCNIGTKLIDTPSQARILEGCSIVIGNITISINNGEHISSELEKSFADVVEVHGQIKIFTANALKSLSFLKKLRRIKGTGATKHVFILFLNRNLENIWDPNTHPPLQIENGLVSINHNPKLCLNGIDEFFDHVTSNVTRAEHDVARDTNGFKGKCTLQPLTLKYNKQAIFDTEAILEWTPFKPPNEDQRLLISYLVHYTETDGVNMASSENDVCGQGWTIKSVIPTSNRVILFNLKPYTQYAAYVKTFTTKTEYGLSNTVFFKTMVSTPSKPRAPEVAAISERFIKLAWQPPEMPNGHTIRYVVRYKAESLNKEEFNKKDFCKNPSKSVVTKTEVVVKEKGNTTVDGMCCTSCENYNIVTVDVAVAQERSQFEDHIIGNIFIKRNGFRRRKREISSLPNGGGTAVQVINEPISTNSTKYNATDVQPSEVDTASVLELYNVTEATLTGLRHFMIYIIDIKACVEHCSIALKNCCSNRVTISTQTKQLATADNVDTSSISVVHESDALLLITWSPPSQPNGPVLHYELEYTRENAERGQVVCITNEKYLNNSGYRLSADNDNLDLRPGKYRIRVRATTLAGSGSWTEHVTVDVGHMWTPAMTAAIVIVMLLIICGSIAGAVIYFKRREAQIPTSVHYASVNPDYWGAECVYVQDEWEVDRDKVKLLQELGQGSFGMVYEGLARDLDTFPEGVTEMTVAVKTVAENANMRDRIEFLNEASVMKSFNSFHVVRLLGVVSDGQPALVVMEMMARGDLKNYLRMHRPDEPDNEGRLPPTLGECLQMAAEIADGMAYLAAKKFVHRDLAARNCMVDENNTVKIGDFGMTRDVYDSDYYRKGGKGLLPVRWMSPEALKDGVFTSASDVWSFGVVLWEMATLAAQPYQGLSNEQVLKFVCDGDIMEMPEGCSEILFDLMLQTWQFYPKQRPTFQDIIKSLEADVDDAFREVSYYHSEENQTDLAHNAEKRALSGHLETDKLIASSEPEKSKLSDGKRTPLPSGNQTPLPRGGVSSNDIGSNQSNDDNQSMDEHDRDSTYSTQSSSSQHNEIPPLSHSTLAKSSSC